MICEHGGFPLPPEDKVRELLSKCNVSRGGELQLSEFRRVESALQKRRGEEGEGIHAELQHCIAWRNVSTAPCEEKTSAPPP